MSNMPPKEPGMIGWIDLAIPNADACRDFYKDVVGWEVQSFDMGEYSDYCMMPPGTKEAVTGVCHARGANANIPPVWMIYINVANLDESLKQVVAHGGKVLSTRNMGEYGKMATISDPAGVICSIIEPKKSAE